MSAVVAAVSPAQVQQAAVADSGSPPASSLASPKTGPSVKFGISDPISLQEATDWEVELSEMMKAELEASFPAETPEGMANRQAVLREIEELFFDWMREVDQEVGATEEEMRRPLVKITTLGSYRLGVVHPGSDIDTLCIGPPHIRREDFFASFVERLSRHEGVEECMPIPEAYTPIVKLKMRGVCIDLLFARLAQPMAEGDRPEEVVKDDEVLRNMDEKSVRCMNGLRVADHILGVIPNIENFRRTLRFVKYWARQRGIYSNVLGFFGGITWSLLVARICQLFPYYAPSQLVHRFFQVYHVWNWPKPVMLCEIVDPQNVPGMSGFKVWNPKTNPGDRQHIMPVITPAFPSMNSTYNVTETTKRILLDEFRRGHEAVNRVIAKQAEWGEVHEPFPFFEYYSNFLCIEVLAKSEEVHRKFSGWVESKLRILIMQLENVPGLLTRPIPSQYDLCGSNVDWPYGCGMFIGLHFSLEDGAAPHQPVDLRPPIQYFSALIKSWTDWDAVKGQYGMRVLKVKRADLPEYARDPEAAKKRPREAPPPPSPPSPPRPQPSDEPPDGGVTSGGSGNGGVEEAEEGRSPSPGKRARPGKTRPAPGLEGENGASGEASVATSGGASGDRGSRSPSAKRARRSPASA